MAGEAWISNENSRCKCVNHGRWGTVSITQDVRDDHCLGILRGRDNQCAHERLDQSDACAMMLKRTRNCSHGKGADDKKSWRLSPMKNRDVHDAGDGFQGAIGSGCIGEMDVRRGAKTNEDL